MNVKNRAAGMMFAVVLAWAAMARSAAADPRPDEHLKVFDCETLSRVIVRQLPMAVELRMPSGNVTLPKVGDTTEERYSQGNVTFWESGNYAHLKEPAGTYLC